MSLEQKINYDNADNFNYTASQIEVTTVCTLFLNGTYSTSNPIIYPFGSLKVTGITSFAETAAKAGLDDIKYYLIVDGENQWFNTGTVQWETSNTNLAQSNTIAELNTNISTLSLGESSLLKVAAILHSDSGATTPTLTDLTVVYDYEGANITTPSKCTVWGYIFDESGNPEDEAIIRVFPDDPANLVGVNYFISNKAIEARTDSTGYWEINLYPSVQYNTDTTNRYWFEIEKTGSGLETRTRLVVPNVSSKEFRSLLA